MSYAYADVPLAVLAGESQIGTCRRLRVVGVLTLQDLMLHIRHIRLHGYRWYRSVPWVGERKAARLVRWLQQHEDTLGPVALTSLQPLAQVPAYLKDPPAAVGVAPIERLRVPSSLSGEQGINRAAPERCKARARNDYQAVMKWLELRRPSGETGNAHTFRAYRKEAERFLLLDAPASPDPENGGMRAQWDAAAAG